MAEQNVKAAQGTKERKKSSDRPRLGDLLVETGLLTRDSLEQALDAQKDTAKRLGQVLIEMNFISEEEVAFALAMQLKMPFLDLRDYSIEKEVIESIPEEVCQKFLCIPIERKDNVLQVSMADPLDLNMMKELQFITGFNIQSAISTPTEILDRLKRHYHPEEIPAEGTYESRQEGLLEFSPREHLTQEEQDEGRPEGHDSRFVKMVDLIVRNAIKKGASDILIEAQKDHVTVRNRVDGVLQDAIKLPKRTEPIIISRIKALGGMDVEERGVPQEGGIKVEAKDLSVDLRVSILPTPYGEKAVIRILKEQEEGLSASCSHCGKAVSLDSKNCPFCKHPLVPACGSCGRTVQSDWVVCPYCKNDLEPNGQA
jgi:type IV pilus assembly protein PilB